MALRTPSTLICRALRLTLSIEPAVFPSQLPPRQLHTTPATLKKRKIAAASNSPPRSSSKTPSSSSSSSSPSPSPLTTSGAAPNPEDPLDFSSLQAAFGPQDTHFKAQLQRILHGGRSNPSSLGGLPIAVKAPDGAHTSFPLRELAQIVPRSGRTISLLVNEREYIKPIMSAVQASREYNQQPQRSGDNDLELLMKVELERKDELIRRVKEATQGWREKIRQARSKHDKVLKGWAKDGTVLRDVVKRAERELQKVQDAKMKEVDAEEAQAIRALER